MIRYNGHAYPLLDTELRVTAHSSTGPIAFEATTPHWQAPYEVAFGVNGLSFRALNGEATIVAPRSQRTLTDLFRELGIKFYFEDETTVERGFLLRPPRNTPPFDPGKLVVLDWIGTNIKKESQGRSRDTDSIQYKIIQMVLAERTWDIVIDDDGSGEAADIVALAIIDDTLLIRLVHCKYSQEVTPGARVKDLYEVCGQTHKSVHWKRATELVDHLVRRERHRQSTHQHSGLEAGTETTLRSLQHHARFLRPRLEIAVVQPGLSASKVSDAQLQLLACAEVYLHETASASLTVYCSA